MKKILAMLMIAALLAAALSAVVYNHVFLNAQNQDQISFTYYPSGHMIYMEKASFDKFRQDAEEWFLKD